MARILPISVHNFMLAVGVVEIVAGILVAIRPRCVVVALYHHQLAGPSGYYDIALRDFGLLLGVLALERMGMVFDK